MIHVMLDLETLGVENDAMILSVGAVKFDPHGAPLPPPNNQHQSTMPDSPYFYRVADPETGGGSISLSTVGWWMKPDLQEAASQTLYTKERQADGSYTGPSPLPLEMVLMQFSHWLFYREPAPAFIWSNGLDFDVVILKNAYKRSGLGHTWPFHYNIGRDFRTIRDLIPPDADFSAMKSIMIKHHAMWDAWYQSQIVWEAYRDRRNGTR